MLFLGAGCWEALLLGRLKRSERKNFIREGQVQMTSGRGQIEACMVLLSVRVRASRMVVVTSWLLMWLLCAWVFLGPLIGLEPSAAAVRYTVARGKN